MTATDADLQRLVSELQEQLRERTRERDAYRRWADRMPQPKAGYDRLAVNAWMNDRPAPHDSAGVSCYDD